MVVEMKDEEVKDVQKLSREVTDMRKEIDGLKEVLSGLIQVMMEHNDQFNDDEEYN